MPEAFTYRPRHCAYNHSVVQCSDPVVRSKPQKRIGRLSARLRVASIAPSSQMLCLRVSGITKMAIRNMIAGIAMG